jgi:hypothetical protein
MGNNLLAYRRTTESLAHIQKIFGTKFNNIIQIQAYFHSNITHFVTW